ncbi:hypothetical protein AMK59_264 [Oryctes borbonicus]|uniref:Alpha-2-macroglobulin domain-containing protein n=1 Tax=Oryctes borbonicus TaxID=1629725 RepID=A0A0T6BH23_9SCAR|nr:hypothetical protein AMK59_264 [Oryctes borbonicus]
MRSILIFFIYYAVCCCYGSEESKDPLDKKNGYAFYYPLHMNVNHKEKVCLGISKHLLPAVVRIGFEGATCPEGTCEPHTVTADFSCWNIIPPASQANKLTVDIETSDKDVKFKEEKNVVVHGNSQRVILETDRSTYKMGDTVKFRILAVNFDLKPVKDYKIASLQVRSPYPSNAIVKEWHNISSNLGLVHLELQLAPDTPEGYWQIIGGQIYGGFEVKKYMLPRFQAAINGPDRIYNGSKSISYSVCGTYSYGKAVKGVALLTAKSRYSYRNEPVTYNQVKNLQGGCAKFEIFKEDLGLNNNRIWSIELAGTVTEDGTEQVESANKYAYVYTEPYSYEWNYKNRFIKPNLPYKAEFALNDLEISLTNSKIEVCYRFLEIDANSTCSNFTLESDNKLEFVIPPLKDVLNDNKLEIQAQVIDHPLNHIPRNTLTVWQSKSKNGIKIIDTKRGPVNCESHLEFTVLYNSGRFADGEEVEFKYILTSRSEILNTGTVLDKPEKKPLSLDEFKNVVGRESYDPAQNPVDKFEVKLDLDKEVYTNAKLLVYYDYDGEVISDTTEIDVNSCTPNLVKAKWAEESLYPGEVGNLNIKADQGSLCSVSSIDKASTFLGSSSRIDTDLVINGFFRYYYDPSQLSCILPNKTEENPGTTTPLPEYIAYRYYSNLYDSFDAFKDSGIGVISNLQFISKLCDESPFYPIRRKYNRPLASPGIMTTALSGVAGPESSVMESARPVAAGFAGASDDAVDNRGSAVRAYFPETWLWDLVTVQDGETNLERKLPDSITNWEGKVVCMSSDKGFGMSEKIEIQGFKPFFVDILLPYSIKRNKEILHLPIPVFNYLNHSLPVRVTLETGNGIVLVDGEDKTSFSMCLAAEDSYTHNYRIKATKLGNLNITVSGFVDPSYAENCAPDSVIKRRDVVQKSLLVEPEGYPSSLSKSALLCANDSSGVDNIKWDISLPENIVPDTVHGKVTVNSDILGPMFQNLENILVVPTGCGEQTMATLTPNLYVLQYLDANDALTDQINEKILKNLEIGYQRMLTYAHDDGSFSAFGKSDKQGSMFLTAFVMRTFKQMKKYIFIDDSVMDKAISWMALHQLDNGCFDPVHHVFHEMGLASSRNQTTALTSYVLISLLETNTKVNENVLAKAKECILNDSTVDKYTLAISSYALGLLNTNQKAKQLLDKLLELADSKDGQLWWKQSEKSQPANVETSSYALISLLRQDPVANLGTASSIVRWLQTQMNPRGAFYSTTDTVVGLDAISRYALLVNKNEPNVKISLATKTDTKEIEITKRDRSRTDSVPFTEYPNEVKAKITGNGCVSIQAAVNYYLDTAADIDDLKLEIELKPVNQKFKCSFVELKPCVSYSGIGTINMAIIEVNMPSGYAPDQASLYALRTENDSGIKKFEILKNQVVFYLTQVGSDKVCLPFTIEENLVVENVANATVKFYDYYKPEVSISKSFKLEDCEANINVPA